MPYEVVIKDQKTGDLIRKELKTLKEFKEMLLLYQDKMIDIKLRQIKKR